MKHPVIVLGLDAADPVILERWMDEGHLPVLARFRTRGAYGRLTTFEYGRAETCNTTFLTGCSPSRHGYWSPFRFSTDYRVQTGAYDYEQFKPFYQLGERFRVAVFDMPQTRLVDGVNGVQVIGWGAHSPRCPSHSDPPELFDEIVARHGVHPTLHKDDVRSMDDERAMRALHEGLSTGVDRRVAACRDLLQREPWDLFLTYFGELHAAQHYFWHYSHADHPLHTPPPGGRDPLLDIFQHVDRAVGEILEAAPADARVVIFSDHGMETNSTDLPSTVLLPELLYRLSFPGRVGLAKGQAGTAPPPVIRTPANRAWRSVVWGLKHDPNPVTRWLRQTLSPVTYHYRIERRLGIADSVPLCPDDCPLGAQPPMWYHPAWPEMRAFALPSFSEGYVRLNVRGREARGIVDPESYVGVRDEITRELEALRNPRTGSPAVLRVIPTRRDPWSAGTGDHASDADLIVLWRSEPIDVVDHPRAGRIGPVPFKRSGSHVHRGFLMAAGPGVPAAATFEERHALDIAPTILTLAGAPIPAHFEGRPIEFEPVAIPAPA